MRTDALTLVDATDFPRVSLVLLEEHSMRIGEHWVMDIRAFIRQCVRIHSIQTLPAHRSDHHQADFFSVGPDVCARGWQKRVFSEPKNWS
jgi:hypothetical protein